MAQLHGAYEDSTSVMLVMGMCNIAKLANWQLSQHCLSVQAIC